MRRLREAVKIMKRTLIAVLTLSLCFTPLHAAGKWWKLLLGGALVAAGTYVVVDGLTTVKKSKYGDITDASYKIVSSDFNETTDSPYIITSTSGIITNDGNVQMRNVTITGHYWDDQINKVYEQSEQFVVDINSGGTFFFDLPDYNSGDTMIKTIGFSASFDHDTIYGYKDSENVKNGNAVLPGILAVIGGSYLMYSYLMDEDVKTADYLDQHGIKVSFSAAPGNARIVLAKRI
jgi:hypothetical protein